VKCDERLFAASAPGADIEDLCCIGGAAVEKGPYDVVAHDPKAPAALVDETPDGVRAFSGPNGRMWFRPSSLDQVSTRHAD
jgi:hypothetical protein